MLGNKNYKSVSCLTNHCNRAVIQKQYFNPGHFFEKNSQSIPIISQNVLDDNNIAIPPIIHKTALPINLIFIKL